MSRWLERSGALAAVVIIPLLLGLFPFPAALATCDRWPRIGAGGASPNGLADRVRRWLARGRGPWKSSCLTRSLVLYAMLRQHGYRPRLHLGVDGDAVNFVAHAWITLCGRPVEQPSTVGEQYQQLLVHGG
jgi:Transglutaminase-like superfamily